MKKIVYILGIFLLIGSSSFSQQMKRHKIEALKTSYITTTLELSPQEAEKFWPVYNKYTRKIQSLKMSLEGGLQRKIKLSGGFDSLSEEQAEDFINEIITIEQQITDNQKLLMKELSNIISYKKIIHLKKAQRDFNRRILQEYGRRRGQKRQ